MAIDYGMPDSGFTVGGGSMGQMSQGMPDAAMLGNILGDLTAKITVWEERIPGDYAGVPKKTKTVEEIDLAELMGGPAPMMMDPNMAPAPPPMMGGMPQMPQMAQMPQMPQPQQMQQPQQQMPGGMGVQAAQSVMQQFG
tara:strand:- start:832 stop:1248 length:417 start_codon:yes stop_codon:yes gene_type:complete